MSTKTTPEVFIIESLNYEDEDDCLEGKLLSDILMKSGKQCIYYYIRTRRELEDVLRRFTESGYRYLHFSCHGNSSCIDTTLDRIEFPELREIVRPHLNGRRLFLSACSATNKALADELMPGSGCLSILGPVDDIPFKTSPILWASLYFVMFEADQTAMKHGVLSIKAQEVANMYGERLNYIRKDKSKKSGYSIRCIQPTKEALSVVPANKKRKWVASK